MLLGKLRQQKGKPGRMWGEKERRRRKLRSLCTEALLMTMACVNMTDTLHRLQHQMMTSKAA